MNIDKHPIYKAIYDLCGAIEKLPPSEYATNLVIQASALQDHADKLIAAAEECERLRVTLESFLRAVEQVQTLYPQTCGGNPYLSEAVTKTRAALEATP